MTRSGAYGVLEAADDCFKGKTAFFPSHLDFALPATTQFSSHQILTVHYIKHSTSQHTSETLHNGYRRESNTVSTSPWHSLTPPRNRGSDRTLSSISTAELVPVRGFEDEQAFNSGMQRCCPSYFRLYSC
jgi:hypothetical protein